LKPKAVGPGSVVGVVAPASPVRKEFVELGVRELEGLGFGARLGPRLITADAIPREASMTASRIGRA
jgi:muramoyltetrapeptide carboxypeptidase LdcA involved in peptidoglycan recycling